MSWFIRIRCQPNSVYDNLMTSGEFQDLFIKHNEKLAVKDLPHNSRLLKCIKRIKKKDTELKKHKCNYYIFSCLFDQTMGMFGRNWTYETIIVCYIYIYCLLTMNKKLNNTRTIFCVELNLGKYSKNVIKK